MSKWDFYVYSYVPKEAVETILNEGLYGGEALLKRPDLLELAAKGRGLSKTKFKKDIEKNLKSWSKESTKGPNVVFHLIPSSQKLSDKHPTKVHKLVPIKINLTQLLDDFPDTELFGMELEVYNEETSIEKDRHHFLNSKELIKFLAMSPKELWSTYNDIGDKGRYSPDVPHMSIHVNNGIIPPQYIQKIKKSSRVEDLYNVILKLC
jgi:hypothetical protein